VLWAFVGFFVRFASSFRYSFCIFPVYLGVPYAFNDIRRLIIKIKNKIEQRFI
jgi:hypothetical protein